MDQENNTKYSSPLLAQKIAKNLGKDVKKVEAPSVGSKAVTDLISKIKESHSKGQTSTLKFD